MNYITSQEKRNPICNYFYENLSNVAQDMKGLIHQSLKTLMIHSTVE